MAHTGGSAPTSTIYASAIDGIPDTNKPKSKEEIALLLPTEGSTVATRSKSSSEIALLLVTEGSAVATHSKSSSEVSKRKSYRRPDDCTWRERSEKEKRKSREKKLAKSKSTSKSRKESPRREREKRAAAAVRRLQGKATTVTTDIKTDGSENNLSNHTPHARSHHSPATQRTQSASPVSPQDVLWTQDTSPPSTPLNKYEQYRKRVDREFDEEADKITLNPDMEIDEKKEMLKALAEKKKKIAKADQDMANLLKQLKRNDYVGEAESIKIHHHHKSNNK